jgi:hypothetical protein
VSIQWPALAVPTRTCPRCGCARLNLDSLFRQGLLAEWQHGTAMDDAVFRLAATIPMTGIHPDQEAFVRHLRAGTAQFHLQLSAAQVVTRRR